MCNPPPVFSSTLDSFHFVALVLYVVTNASRPHTQYAARTPSRCLLFPLPNTRWILFSLLPDVHVQSIPEYTNRDILFPSFPLKSPLCATIPQHRHVAFRPATGVRRSYICRRLRIFLASTIETGGGREGASRLLAASRRLAGLT
jgi:hypothetical protein